MFSLMSKSVSNYKQLAVSLTLVFCILVFRFRCHKSTFGSNKSRVYSCSLSMALKLPITSFFRFGQHALLSITSTNFMDSECEINDTRK